MLQSKFSLFPAASLLFRSGGQGVVAEAMCQVVVLLNENKANSAQLCWVGAQAELGKNIPRDWKLSLISHEAGYIDLINNVCSFKDSQKIHKKLVY